MDHTRWHIPGFWQLANSTLTDIEYLFDEYRAVFWIKRLVCIIGQIVRAKHSVTFRQVPREVMAGRVTVIHTAGRQRATDGMVYLYVMSRMRGQKNARLREGETEKEATNEG